MWYPGTHPLCFRTSCWTAQRPSQPPAIPEIQLLRRVNPTGTPWAHSGHSQEETGLLYFCCAESRPWGQFTSLKKSLRSLKSCDINIVSLTHWESKVEAALCFVSLYKTLLQNIWHCGNDFSVCTKRLNVSSRTHLYEMKSWKGSYHMWGEVQSANTYVQNSTFVVWLLPV